MTGENGTPETPEWVIDRDIRDRIMRDFRAARGWDLPDEERIFRFRRAAMPPTIELGEN